MSRRSEQYVFNYPLSIPIVDTVHEEEKYSHNHTPAYNYPSAWESIHERSRFSDQIQGRHDGSVYHGSSYSIPIRQPDRPVVEHKRPLNDQHDYSRSYAIGDSGSSGSSDDSSPSMFRWAKSRSQRYYCDFEDCIDKDTGKRRSLGRKADLKRHRLTVHGKPKYDCPMPRCARKGNEGFCRECHLTEHLKNYHNQDVLFQKTSKTPGSSSPPKLPFPLPEVDNSTVASGPSWVRTKSSSSIRKESSSFFSWSLLAPSRSPPVARRSFQSPPVPTPDLLPQRFETVDSPVSALGCSFIEARFELVWDRVVFDDIKDADTLDSILTITGSEQDAQAMTCAQYVKKTWPRNGMFLWKAIRDALLKSGIKLSSKDEMEAQVSLRFIKSSTNSALAIHISGSRSFIADAAEQLCWISAALSSAPLHFHGNILRCSPSLQRMTSRPSSQSSDHSSVLHHETMPPPHNDHFSIQNSNPVTSSDRIAAKAKVSAFLFGTPLRSLGKMNLGGNRLKEYLDEIYPDLPCKGPRNQTPQRLEANYRFYCPACFHIRRCWIDMRVHLRRDHHVENQNLDRLFPQNRNTAYLQCFGGFSPAEADENGMSAGSPSRVRSSSDPSSLKKFQTEAVQDELGDYNDPSILSTSVNMNAGSQSSANNSDSKVGPDSSFAPEDFIGRRTFLQHVRAQSCLTCRKRRVKCDEKRPSCDRCVALDFICDWKSADVQSVLQSSQQTLADHSSSQPEHAGRVQSYRISPQYERGDKNLQDGTCWQSLFSRCVIIQGFPILQRPRTALGLELSLEMIAKIIGNKYLQQFGEHLFFKQFSVMLAPTSRIDEVLIWHACKSNIGDRISYLDHGVEGLQKVSLEDLLQVRHIVGWCSNIQHLGGHAEGDYNVESCFLPSGPPSGALFNCQLSFGRSVNSEIPVYFSSNHQRASITRRNPLEMLRFLEKRAVLFWDTGTSRGWLMNGLRAFLHSLRQSLKIDEREDVGGRGLFVLKAEDLAEPKQPCDAQAAREFLSNIQNMSARISISDFRTSNQNYELLSDRVERIFDVFEKAFDYQKSCKIWDQIPRRYLEGWNFVSIAGRDEIIEPSMLTLPSIGKGWVDFVRATATVTLLGDGFGEMLKPKMPQCGPMPCDRFCVAVGASDLREMLKTNRCKMGAKPTLLCRCPSILWYTPPGSLDLCGCQQKKKKKKKNMDVQKCLQTMWPSTQAALLPERSDDIDFDQYRDGAFIFGHHETLQHYPADLGLTLISGSPPNPTKELEMVDSGIGSSINSTGSLENVSTKSPLSSLYELEPVMTSSSHNSQTYGNTLMTGGYGIYGNITGNISVNQYFGSANKPEYQSPNSALVSDLDTAQSHEPCRRKRRRSA